MNCLMRVKSIMYRAFIWMCIHLNLIDICSCFIHCFPSIRFLILFLLLLRLFVFVDIKKIINISHECICVTNTQILFEHPKGFNVRHELKTIAAVAATCWLHFDFNCSAWPYSQNIIISRWCACRSFSISFISVFASI